MRTSLGQDDLNDPRHLGRLLAVMARNKVASAARREYRDKRDRRRTEGDDENLAGACAPQATPSQIVAGRELLEARGLFAADERKVADLRGQGFTWEEVAAEVGGTAHACRVRFGRSVNRVMRALGMDDFDD